MEDYITRTEHTEFARRVDEENGRQNDRLNSLEATLKQVLSISTSVEKLAIHMEHMSDEQKSQGERLKVLEDRDGEKWRTVATHILTMIITAIVTFVLSKIGL